MSGTVQYSPPGKGLAYIMHDFDCPLDSHEGETLIYNFLYQELTLWTHRWLIVKYFLPSFNIYCNF